MTCKSCGRLILIAVALSLVVLAVGAAETPKLNKPTKPAHPATLKYVGAKKCKVCHNTEAMGRIYDKWMSTPHARAFAVLASDTAKAVAKKLGIDNPQKSEKCLKCHTVDFERHKTQAPDMAWEAEGIGCEECHGPGEKYYRLAVMNDKKLSANNGLIMPTEKTCLKCHNNPENPFKKTFVFREAFLKIKHKKAWGY